MHRRYPQRMVRIPVWLPNRHGGCPVLPHGIHLHHRLRQFRSSPPSWTGLLWVLLGYIRNRRTRVRIRSLPNQPARIPHYLYEHMQHPRVPSGTFEKTDLKT